MGGAKQQSQGPPEGCVGESSCACERPGWSSNGRVYSIYHFIYYLLDYPLLSLLSDLPQFSHPLPPRHSLRPVRLSRRTAHFPASFPVKPLCTLPFTTAHHGMFPSTADDRPGYVWQDHTNSGPQAAGVGESTVVSNASNVSVFT